MVIIQNNLQGRKLLLLANIAAFIGQRVTFTSSNLQDKEKLHRKVRFVLTEGNYTPKAFIGGEGIKD